MMLNLKELANPVPWRDAGIALPDFDREQVAAQTIAAPSWLHCGAGNIFRAFPAVLLQELLEKGVASTGIVVAEGFDYEIIDRVFLPHDGLSLVVTLKTDGSIGKTVVGSVMEALKMDSSSGDFDRVKEVCRSPSLQMISFTITEKGYSLHRGGALLPEVSEDLTFGPGNPASYMGKVATLVYERYLAGKLPLALVSMDNCSHNGDKLAEAITAFAEGWTGAGLVEAGFLEYVNDRNIVTFPLTMIDKITPRPDDGVRQMLAGVGFTDAETVVTSKGTYTAPFVNAEEAEYLVVEDRFPNGRPELEKAGVYFTDRLTVDKVEKMKVCTCLNPLHTALAVFGCLLSYTRISDEMRDDDLRRLVERIGYVEGLPVVVDPGIIDPKTFLDEVVRTRFPNPFMPDTPQRIACDTSQKLSIRFGETIKAYVADPELSVGDLRCIPLVFAGWCRYLMGVDDAGNGFEVSPDPMLGELSGYFAGLRLGSGEEVGGRLRPVLSDAGIFGVDLYKVGLGERVEGYFGELVAGVGAVRAVLRKYVN